jgi:tight adherence protein B
VSDSRFEEIASMVQRLSVLLAAGVPPTSVWGYLDGSRYGEIVAKVMAATESGGDIPSALIASSSQLPDAEGVSMRVVAAAWRVATDAGAPLAAALSNFATALRSLADADREVEVALAGPIATARLVMALPVVGVVFALLLGFNTLGILFTTRPGNACCVVGIVLMVAARAWNSRLVRRARTRDVTPGLRCELMAIAVTGGGALDSAESSVATALEECRLDPQLELETVVDVLALSRRAGVPAAGMLRSEAEERRREARAQSQKAAAVLAVRLMLPLGVCVLPAFMLLGVAPLLIAVISSTVATL